ncbi:MAG: DUF2127 domain-containing protein [Candidatus Paceibacterota bacterium]
MMNNFSKNKELTHKVFIVSIAFKGLNGIAEIIGGLVAFFVTQDTVLRIVNFLVKQELVEDPGDIISQFLIHTASTYTSTAQTFVALYLLSHGVLKVFLVHNLFKGKMWAYPVAMVVFALFGISQTIAILHKFNLGLLILTIFDLVIILLTYLEYRQVRQKKYD